MKYTIEQKRRLNGMDCFNHLKYEISKQYRLGQDRFTLQGDYIVIASKINRNRHLNR